MIRHDVIQKTPEWWALRIGMPTASRFGDVMAAGEGKTRDLYLRQLAGELICGQPMETFSTAAMEHGSLVEPEAAAHYQMATGHSVEPVGFVTTELNGSEVGASPDGFVDCDGMVEFKRVAPHLLIDAFRSGNLPGHTWQLQGGMWVCERSWCDLVGYYPGMPLYRRRVKRDDNAIARLKIGLEVFVTDLALTVQMARGWKP